MAYGFSIDMEKCVGCHGCSVACKAANGTPPGVTRSKVVRTTEGTYPDAKRVIRPMLCMLCEAPACVTSCPADAILVRPEDGIVTLDKELCIGCWLCIPACPYGARYAIESDAGYFGNELNPYEDVAYIDKKSGIVDKCDFCIEYNGGEEPNPVCVKACMTGARMFGDLDKIKELVAERNGEQYMPESNTSPRVFYLPVVDA